MICKHESATAHRTLTNLIQLFLYLIMYMNNIFYELKTYFKLSLLGPKVVKLSSLESLVLEIEQIVFDNIRSEKGNHQIFI